MENRDVSRGQIIWQGLYLHTYCNDGSFVMKFLVRRFGRYIAELEENYSFAVPLRMSWIMMKIRCKEKSRHNESNN